MKSFAVFVAAGVRAHVAKNTMYHTYLFNRTAPNFQLTRANPKIISAIPIKLINSGLAKDLDRVRRCKGKIIKTFLMHTLNAEST